MSKKAKPRIRQNVYGNWIGYLGTHRAESFGVDKEEAERWEYNQLYPIQTYGEAINPETGERAPVGNMWVCSVMNQKWVLQSDRTPWSCSVASESYWAS